jgi:hypothetical protein
MLDTSHFDSLAANRFDFKLIVIRDPVRRAWVIAFSTSEVADRVPSPAFVKRSTRDGDRGHQGRFEEIK